MTQLNDKVKAAIDRPIDISFNFEFIPDTKDY